MSPCESKIIHLSIYHSRLVGRRHRTYPHSSLVGRRHDGPSKRHGEPIPHRGESPVADKAIREAGVCLLAICRSGDHVGVYSCRANMLTAALAHTHQLPTLTYLNSLQEKTTAPTKQLYSIAQSEEMFRVQSCCF